MPKMYWRYSVPGTGAVPNPTPVLLCKPLTPSRLQVMPDWERLTAHIEAHKDTKDALGWVGHLLLPLAMLIIIFSERTLQVHILL